MSKLIVNSKIIAELNPCADRYDNWLKHYSKFNGDILEFLELENISATDKIWFAVRAIAERDEALVEVERLKNYIGDESRLSRTE